MLHLGALHVFGALCSNQRHMLWVVQVVQVAIGHLFSNAELVEKRESTSFINLLNCHTRWSLGSIGLHKTIR